MTRLCLLALAVCHSVSAEDDSLVARYSFDRGMGARAEDRSGNGHHGRIHGATFVASPQGHALQFDGADDFVDCGIRHSFRQLEWAGTIAFWFKPQTFQGGIINWSTGADWPDQRLVIAFKNYHGSTEFIQVSSDALGHRERALDMPAKDTWSHVAVTFDGGTVTCFLDGVVRHVFWQDSRPNLEGVPLWIGRSSGLGAAYFKGILDEVSVYRRVLDPLEILGHYKAQAKLFNQGSRSFTEPMVRVRAIPEPGWIAVETDYALMRPLPKSSVVRISLRDADGRRQLTSKTQPVPISSTSVTATLDATGVPAGMYQVLTSLRDADGNALGATSRQTVMWPGQPQEFQGVRILNNLVWELLRVPQVAVNKQTRYAFSSPKSRWVHVSASAEVTQGNLQLAIESGRESNNILVFDSATKHRQEAMRYLPAGKHKLVLSSTGPCRIQDLVIRSIPELLLHEFIFRPTPAKLGMSAEVFRERFVMNNVNTFVIAPSHLEHPFFKKWQSSGKRWLTNLVVPRARGNVEIREPQHAFQYISGSPGFKNAFCDGVIADEFITSEPHCGIYAEAVRSLKAAAPFHNRKFYVYANELYDGAEGRALVQSLVETDSAIAWKHYLPTHTTESAARHFLQQELVRKARNYRELCPGSIDHIAVCPGNFSKVGGHLLNSTPAVNHKTYLDMQYNTVANDPVFWGTYGLMSYHTGYTDEETVRWISRLFRHYGIEGNRRAASRDPYVSPHIVNGDFLNGLHEWKISAAEKNSVRAAVKRGLGVMQARYKSSEGETGAVTVRNSIRPNTITQEIKNLAPGHYYTFRMITSDYDDMSKPEKHAIGVEFDNVTTVPEKFITHVFPNPEWGAYPPYDGHRNKGWMNYHWYLFRARGKTARVTIRDWAEKGQAGGPIGQQLMFNFLQVHPYFSATHPSSQ